ncbi:hypothetical protein [Pseudomonas mosselii]|nr:hypothetical protein [Pseudomonas mosselii]
MTWTTEQIVGLLLLAMFFSSTWCVTRGQLIANRRKKENGQ